MECRCRGSGRRKVDKSFLGLCCTAVDLDLNPFELYVEISCSSFPSWSEYMSLSECPIT